ncbi:MAG: hypothetical protein GY925_10605 [Actinomycetia bacterium]|nr:hypothetical protein [Actinomycetes bacterium]
MWKLQDDTGAVAEAIAGVEAISVDRVEWTCDGYSLALIGSAGESRLEVLDRLEVALTDLSFERNGLYRFERDRDDAFDADLVLVSPEQQGQRIDLAVTVADGDSLRCLPGWLAGDLDVLGETPRR